MIWILLTIIIVGIIIADSIRSKTAISPLIEVQKTASLSERINDINAGISELETKLESGYLEEIQYEKKASKERKEQAKIRNKRDFEDIFEGVKNAEDSLREFSDMKILCARISEALRFQEEELLKQQIDYFNLLEYNVYLQSSSKNSREYLKYGLDPPEISDIEQVKAKEIWKRINSRAR